MEQVEVARGIREFGMLATTAAFFLVFSAVMMLVFIRFFTYSAWGLLEAWMSCIRARQRADLLEENQRTWIDRAEYYRTSDSLSAAGVSRLQLSADELECYNRSLTDEIKILKIKLKRVVSATWTATETNYEIVAPNLKQDTGVKVVYRDAYLSIDGAVRSDSFRLSVRSVDTLVQVVHRIPKRFWFIRYGTKGIRQEITSKNPNTTIVYSEYIELKE